MAGIGEHRNRDLELNGLTIGAEPSLEVLVVHRVQSQHEDGSLGCYFSAMSHAGEGVGWYAG